MQLAGPEDGSTISGSQSISAQVSPLLAEMAGVTFYYRPVGSSSQYNYGSLLFTDTNGSDGWNFNWDTATRLDGSYELWAYMYSSYKGCGSQCDFPDVYSVYEESPHRTFILNNGVTGLNISIINSTPAFFPDGDDKSDTATIHYELERRTPGEANLTIRIYDSQDNLVRTLVDDESRSIGNHCTYAACNSVTWDGKSDSGSVVPDGQYTFRIDADDSLGNTAIQRSGRINVLQNPIWITAPADSSAASGAVTVSAATSELFNPKRVEFVYRRAASGDSWQFLGLDEDGSDGWSATWDSTNRIDGQYEISAFASGGTGSELGGDSPFFSDQSNLVSLTVNNSNLANITSVSSSSPVFSPNGNGSVDSVSINYTVESLEQGDATVTIRIYDAQNNLVRILVNGEPRRTGKGEPGFGYGGVSTAYATVAGGYLFSSSLDYPGNSEKWDGTDNSGQLLPDGVYVYRIDATDAAGHVAAQRSGTVTLIKEPVVITAPAEGANLNGVYIITATVSSLLTPQVLNFYAKKDSEVGPATIGIDRDGTDGWSMAWDTALWLDGSWTVFAAAGNPYYPPSFAGYSLPRTHNLDNQRLINIDDYVQVVPYSFAPNNDGVNERVSICYSLESPLAGSAAVSIRIYDSQDHLVRTLLAGAQRSIGSGSVNYLTGEGGEIWDGTDDSGTLLPDGTYTIRVDASVSAGKPAIQRQTTVTLVRNPVQLSSPDDGTEFSGLAVIIAEASPLTYIYDGVFEFRKVGSQTAWKSLGSAYRWFGSPDWAANWHTAELLDGDYEVRVGDRSYSYGATNQANYSSSRTYTVRNGNLVNVTDINSLPYFLSPNGDGVNDSASIGYTIESVLPGTSAFATIRIYDSEGNLVKTLLDNQQRTVGPGTVFSNPYYSPTSPSSGTCCGNYDAWVGTDDTGTVTPDGMYTYRIDVTDSAGNIARQKSGKILLVKNPLRLASPASGASLSGSVMLSADVSPLLAQQFVNFEYRKAGSSDYWKTIWGSSVPGSASGVGNVNWDTTTVLDGSYEVRSGIYISYSYAGSPGTEYSQPGTYILNNGNFLNIITYDYGRKIITPNGDGTGETVSIDYLLEAASQGEDASVTIKIYDSRNNLVRTLVDGQLRRIGLNLYQYGLPLQHMELWNGRNDTGVIVPDGEYAYKIDAVDAAGHQARQKSGKMTVINVPVSLVGLTNGATLSGLQTLTAETAAGQYISKAVFLIRRTADTAGDAGEWKQIGNGIRSGNNRWILQLNTADYLDGAYEVRVGVDLTYPGASYSSSFYYLSMPLDYSAVKTITLTNGTQVIITDISSPRQFTVDDSSGTGSYASGLEVRYTVESLVSGDALVTIRIYDDQNNLVRALVNNEQRKVGKTYETSYDEGTITAEIGNIDRWDGRNDTGNLVPDGIYSYLIDASVGGVSAPQKSGQTTFIAEPIIITLPADGTVIKGSQTFTAELSPLFKPEPDELSYGFRVNFFYGPAYGLFVFPSSKTGTNRYSGTWDTTDVPDGEYNIYAAWTSPWAWHDIGTTWRSPAIKVAVRNSPVWSEVTTPLNNAVVNTSPVRIQGTATDETGAGIARVDIRIVNTRTGTEVLPWTATILDQSQGTWTYDFAPSDWSIYRVQSRAVSNTGQVENSNYFSQFTYGLPPEIISFSPEEGATLGGNANLKLKIQAHEGFSSYNVNIQYSLDNGNTWKDDSAIINLSSNWASPDDYLNKILTISAYWNTHDIRDGDVLVKAFVTDPLGLISDTPLRTYTLDHSGSDLQVIDIIAPASAFSGQNFQLTWTVTNTGTAKTGALVWYDEVGLYSENDQYVASLGSFQYSGSLAAGASYQQTQNVSIPASFTGNRYIKVTVDKQGDVFEYNLQGTAENNNRLASAIYVLPPYPDLQVTGLQAPVEAWSGQSIDISWAVTNSGKSTVSGNYWVDKIFLSSDNQFGGDTYLGQFVYNGILASEDIYQRTESVRLPDQIEGSFWIIAVTDGNSYVYEANTEGTAERNNWRVVAEPLFILAKHPNLEVADVSTASFAVAGQKITIEWTVINTGSDSTSAQYWYDKIWLSKDEVLDKDDKELSKVRNASFLGVSGSYISRIDLFISQGIEGIHYFIVQTDSSNNVKFENEGDNFLASSPVSILFQPADLQVESINVQAEAIEGQYIYVSWSVVNKGTGQTPAFTGWWDEIWLSSDAILDSADSKLGAINRNVPLVPEAAYSSGLEVNLPEGFTGNYYMIVKTDFADSVNEQNWEENNTKASSLIQIKERPKPDLSVTWIEAPESALAGQNITIKYRVSNIGQGITNVNSWRDRFFLSKDTLYSSEDKYLGDWTRYGSIDVGHFYEYSTTFTLSQSLSGNYYILAIADFNDNVNETNNVNNTGYDSVATAIDFRPADLVVTSLTAPQVVESGKSVLIEWTVANQGSGDTVSSWTDSLYTSPNESLSDAVHLGSFYQRDILAAGQSITQKMNVMIPPNFKGRYYLFLKTDTSDNVYEYTSEGNNQSGAVAFDVLQTAPDLQVTQLNAPVASYSGEEITIEWTVRNNGTGATSYYYWYDGVYLSSDASYDNKDLVIEDFYHQGVLDSSATYTVGAKILIPQEKSGNYYLIVRSDAYNHVFEAGNEVNNDSNVPIAITLGQVPDLAVTGIVLPVGSKSGQSFSIEWSVENHGSDASRSWQDVFYLSRDKYLDRATDKYLGYEYHYEGLASGAGYKKSKSLTIPYGLTGPFHVFVITDFNNSVYERTSEQNNTAYSETAISVSLPLPADLVVSDINVPATAIVGKNFALTYTVENRGDNAAQGNWHDAVYISSDDKWDIGDYLLGAIHHYEDEDVSGGGSYQESLTVPLAGLIPGNYFVIVRSDTTNLIPEADEANNLNTASSQVTIDVDPISPGVPVTGNLGQAKSVYYRLDVVAGQTLIINLDSESTAAANELYISHNKVPSRSQFDYKYANSFAPDQEITIPSTLADTYYILAYGNSVPSGSQAYNLSAYFEVFTLKSVTPGVVKNTGPTTIEIKGAKFTPGTVFKTRGASGVLVEAEKVELKDSSTAFATFNFQGYELGAYDVIANGENGDESVLAGALTVEKGFVGKLEISISGPSDIRPDRDYIFLVNYRNIGDADLPAPLIIIQSKSNTPLGLTTTERFIGKKLEILGISFDGPAGILRPGQQFSIPVYFTSSTTSTDFEVSVVNSEDTSPINWLELETAIRPSSISEAEWNLLWNNLQARIGTDWGGFVEMLGSVASLLSSRGYKAHDVKELVDVALMQEAGIAGTNLYGRLIDSDSGVFVPSVFIVAQQEASDGTLTVGTAMTDQEGNFSIYDLPSGTYEIFADGYYFDAPPIYTITRDSDVREVLLSAHRVSANEELPGAHTNEDDVSASLVTDQQGVLHIIYKHGDDIYHAFFNGSEWNAAAIPGAHGFSPRIWASENLIDGNTSGLIVSWQDGAENSSDIYYTVAKMGANGNYEWSQPKNLTADNIYDNNPALLGDQNGRVLFIYQKSTSGINDDTDLYYNFINIDSSALQWSSSMTQSVELANLTEIQSDSGLNAMGCSKFNACGGTQSGELLIGKILRMPENVPLIGGEKVGIKIGGSYEWSQCCGNVTQAIEPIVEIDFTEYLHHRETGSLEFYWVATEDCGYVIDRATMSFGIGTSGEIPIPVSKALKALQKIKILKGVQKHVNLEFGLKAVGKVDANAVWENPTNFPSLPTSGNITHELELGPYGKIKITKYLEASISGRGYLKAQYLPDIQFLEGRLLIELSGKLGPFEGSWSGDLWEHEFGSGSSAMMQILALNQASLASYMQNSGFSLSYNPEPGKGNVYGTNSIITDITGDLFNDGEAGLGNTVDGSFLAAWAKDVIPNSGQIGSIVNISQYSTSGWGEFYEIAGSTGFNNDISTTFDTSGNQMLVWLHAETGSLTPDSSTEEVFAAMASSKVVYSVSRNGVWSDPVDVAPITGNAIDVLLGKASDGTISVIWATEESDGTILYISNWDGSGWTNPVIITIGDLLEVSGITQIAGKTTVFWVEDIDPSLDVDEYRIFFSNESNGVWTEPTAFMPHVSKTGGITGLLNNDVENSINFIKTQPSLPLINSNGSVNGGSSSGLSVLNYATSLESIIPKMPADCDCWKNKDKTIVSPGLPYLPDAGGIGISDIAMYNPTVARPMDPNDIIGPAGFGDDYWIKAEDPLLYTIRFENAASATAPAQEIIITQQLDADLDWKSFRLGDFGWDNRIFTVPDNSSFYSNRLDLREKYGLYVDVIAQIDIATGLVTWKFTSVDPATGELPMDALAGFLFPNDDTGRGDGFVSYIIHSRKDILSGDLIDAQAVIIFDTEAPIDTPPIFNTLDAGLPVSAVNSLEDRIDQTMFTVSWAGNDDDGGSGLAGYDIYIADNGGPFTLWLENTTLTEAPFMGQSGHTYTFYSVARDNVGHVENASDQNVVLTNVNIHPTASFTASPVSGPEPLTVTFTDTSVSVDGIVAYLWSFGDGATSSEQNPVHTYTDNGTYTVSLMVTEADTDTSTETKAAFVTVSNVAATINAGADQLVNEGGTVNINAAFTDPGVLDTHTATVDWGDGSAPQTLTVTEAAGSGSLSASHIYADNGTYTVTVRVTDNGGAAGEDTLQVSVGNLSPQASIDAVKQPHSLFILPGQQLDFEASFSDAGWLDTHIALWQWGDSTANPGWLDEQNTYPQAVGTTTGSHAYAGPGVYTVTLMITDDDGGNDSANVVVEVAAPEDVVELIIDRISILPDTAFSGNAEQRRNSLEDFLEEVSDLVAEGKYTKALKKLDNNVSTRLDGALGGNPANDWITDAAAQQELGGMIDALRDYLSPLAAALGEDDESSETGNPGTPDPETKTPGSSGLSNSGASAAPLWQSAQRTGELPDTGFPFLPAALAAAGLLGSGMALRRKHA